MVGWRGLDPRSSASALAECCTWQLPQFGMPPAPARVAFDPMSEGNATLKEAFRHNAWATRQLLAFCAQLRPEQLWQPRPAPLAGVHGSILETFDHIVC